MYRATPMRTIVVPTMAALLVGSCGGGEPPAVDCMSVGGAPSPLVTSAALLRVDIYGPRAACNGNTIVAGNAPMSSRTFAPGEPIAVDVSPGVHTVVLTTFADAAGTIALGAACAAARFAPAQRVCLDLTLAPLCCNAFHGTCSDDCSIGCEAGHADCDGDPANGCETDTTTVTNCGGCGNRCDTANSFGASCDGSTCTYTGCAPGRADCHDAAPDTDGCETTLDSDVGNCGSCGRACSGANVASGGVRCSGGACVSQCAPSWGNCSLPPAGIADDGCESNLTSCAGTPCCGTQCSATHANGTGQGYADCSPFGVAGTNSYTPTMAEEAATADNVQDGSIVLVNGSPILCCNCASADEVREVCKSSNGTLTASGTWSCTCWSYDAPGSGATPPSASALSSIGYVATGATICPCLVQTSTSWN